MEAIKTICCAAGKSGGHIIPNLVWANQVKTENEKLLFFSANSPLDFKLLKSKVDIHAPLSLRRPRWYLMPVFLLQCINSFIKSFFYLMKYKPAMVLSTGGITAMPVCIAAYLLRIPIELFELNATPGIAIRWLSPLASKIHVCFRTAKSYFPQKKCIVSPYPIRFDENQPSSKIFGDSERMTIFVQGGSQGSVSLNKKVKVLIQQYPNLAAQINIIHQTGSIDSFDWKQFYHEHQIPAHVFTFDDNLAPYYLKADLIICRSGAGQLFEAVHFKKPCITVPLEIPGNTHQLENAQAIAQEYEYVKVVTHNENLTDAIKQINPAVNKVIFCTRAVL